MIQNLPANQLRRMAKGLLIFIAAAVFPATGFSVDPPHTDGTDYCTSCHLMHQATGAPLLNVPGGNANLCQSCHVPGGAASAKALLDGDQAMPAPGLPPGTVPGGNSHRWDSSASGRVVYLGGAANPSMGAVLSGGTNSGPYPQTYTLTVASAGNVGVARFNWTVTTPGGGYATNLSGGFGNNLLTGTNVALTNGIKVTFTTATNSFYQTNDRWRIFVRTDLRHPTNSALLANLPGGHMMCSTCHDPHSQLNPPFDPNAPDYTTNGLGAGRHYQVMDNSSDQMCQDCHAARSVTNSTLGSHPVNVLIATNAYYKKPGSLPLSKTGNRIACETCHAVHFSPDNDGNLVRMTNRLAFCTDCHTLADTATPARHLNVTNSLLWPGGRTNCSTFPPITDTTLRGACENCHQAHGWPVATNTAAIFPKLLVDQEESLCFTCHGTNGPAATKVEADFSKTYRHPVNDAQQKNGRVVECNSCHNPHKALAGSHLYSTSATAARNLASNSLKGADGVAFNYAGLTNFQTVATNRYTVVPKSTGVTYEYQICLKCHSSYAWGTGTPPNGLSPNGSAATPVETDAAQEFSPNNKSGHPVVTGLNNYSNSILVGSTARRGLQPAALKAPWNLNVGTQTMMCSDCHNTDAATPAAQGPHGSALQYMLRGPNAANWPNVTLANYNTSWCANCHTSMNNVHRSNHSSRQCYICHIVVPHGGKLSRLMADNDTMPARYAYNNTRNTSYLQAFTKNATNSYSSSNCKAQCHSEHSGRSPSENW
jgi:predicted CXXCH cytochrome family protein